MKMYIVKIVAVCAFIVLGVKYLELWKELDFYRSEVEIVQMEMKKIQGNFDKFEHLFDSKHDYLCSPVYHYILETGDVEWIDFECVKEKDFR